MEAGVENKGEVGAAALQGAARGVVASPLSIDYNAASRSSNV